MSSLRSRIVQKIMRDAREAFLGKMPLLERRRRMDAAARRGIRIPRGIAVRPVAAGGVPAEWLEPDKADTGPIILFLHGGGYVICSPTTHRGLAARIALASSCNLLLIGYRLAPEHPFPAALDDALAAWHYLLDQGFSPHQIVIGGDSAGGGLALATSLWLRDHHEPGPAALFLLSPWTDLTFSGIRSIPGQSVIQFSPSVITGWPPLMQETIRWIIHIYPLFFQTFMTCHQYISRLVVKKSCLTIPPDWKKD